LLHQKQGRKGAPGSPGSRREREVKIAKVSNAKYQQGPSSCSTTKQLKVPIGKQSIIEAALRLVDQMIP
jgi:hypothetical protein